MNAEHSSLFLPSAFIDGKIAQTILTAAGKNRAPECELQIKAKTDLEAVYCWLKEYASIPTTHRAYQREAQRLLLWCAVDAKKTLSDLTRDDFERYSEFLRDPQPKHLWCGPRSKNKATWKPFVSGLSQSARATAMTILHSLMQYLVQAGFLMRNPLLLLRKKVKIHAEQVRKIKTLERQIEQEEIVAILQTIEELSEMNDKERFEKNRLRFLIYLLLLTGLRVNEIITHQWNAFRCVQGRWWIFILGKGQKPRFVPVNDELLQQIKQYRQYLKKPPYPMQNDDDPLLISQRRKSSITSRQVHHLIHGLMVKVAEKFRTQPDKHQRLKNLSVHGFRHIFASLQDQANIPLIQIRDNLGHNDIKTTGIYLHSADLARHAALQKIDLVMKKTTFTENKKNEK